MLVSAVFLTLLSLTVSGCNSEGDDVFTGTRVQTPFQVSNSPLRADNDMGLSFADDLDAPLSLVFFGYTHCPNICPTVLLSLASGLLKVTDEERNDVDVYFVTTDPARDTMPVMNRYLDRFDPDFVPLSGDLETIAEVAKSVGIYVDEGKAGASDYDPNAHTSYVVAINSTGEGIAVWDSETAPSQFAADIESLLAAEE